MLDGRDHAEITGHLHAYAAAWSQNRADVLESYWDTSDPTPLYVAEEIDRPMLDWPALRGYWVNNEKLHARINLVMHEIAVKPIAADFALVISNMDWTIAFNTGASPAMGGDNRVLASLRRTSEGWRLCAWLEAPLAAITYIRRLYEKRVPAGFTNAGVG